MNLSNILFIGLGNLGSALSIRIAEVSKQLMIYDLNLQVRDEIQEKHDEFIHWPNINVSEGAAKITGFSKKKYNAKSKAPNQVWEKFAKHLTQ